MKAACLMELQPILCVIPYSVSDSDLTIDLLEWISELGGCKRNPVLLVADCKVPRPKQLEILELAKRCFKEASAIETPGSLEDESWPRGANYLFDIAAKEVAQTWKRPFWWNEPDCIPTKPYWLEYIEWDYYKSGKAFAGFILPKVERNGITLGPCVNGCAVYPADTKERFKDLNFYGPEAWDILASPLMVPETHASPMIQHFWGEMGLAPTFRKFHEKGEPRNVFALEQLSKSAYVFHRNKDGSLIQLLRSSRQVKPQVFVLLGRNGDLIQMLPAFREIQKKTGVNPIVMVSKNYSQVLEGVSYVTSDVINKDWYMGVPDAISLCKQRYGVDPTVIQSHGHNWGVDMKQASTYGASMWKRAGFTEQEMRSFPLEFDRRDKERESELVRLHIKPQVKNLLYNFKGISSPFKHSGQIISAFARSLAGWNLIDLSKITAHRLYDLLGLYDAADGLITSDTATMHLAAAGNIRYIGFVVGGWSCSVPKGRCELVIPYARAAKSMAEMLSVLEGWKRPGLKRFFHVYLSFDSKDSSTILRNSVAKASWSKLAWTEIEAKSESLPRVWNEAGRTWNYLKDVLDFGANGLDDDDVLVFTNTDTYVRSDAIQVLTTALRSTNAVYGYRRDFAQHFTEPPPDSLYCKGNDYCGSDIYAFRVSWWRKNRDQMPDMLIGAEAGDPVLRHIIDSTNRGSQNVVRNLIAHTRHASFWEQPQNRYRLEVQKHCLRTAAKFFRDRKINPAKHGIRDV